MAQTTLTLSEKLTKKEMEKFRLSNTLQLEDFAGYQYALCIGAVFKNAMNEFEYRKEFSKTLIDNNVKPNQLISFCELHKDMIIKEKNFADGRFTTLYYLVYSREEKPTLLNEFKISNKKKVDVELIFNYDGFYRAQEIHLDLSENTSVLSALQVFFSEDNIDNLSFIKVSDKEEPAKYSICYYDDFGYSKDFKFTSVNEIYRHITNIRLVGYKEYM